MTGWHNIRLPLATALDHEVPRVPFFLIAYVSLYPMILWAFHVQHSSQLYLKKMLAAVFLGAVIHLMVPGRLDFPRVPPEGIFSLPFELLYALDKPHNLAPSLHVVFACFSASQLSRAHPGGRPLFLGWCVLIVASTVLTHQHHLIDVVTGWAFFLVVERIFRQSKQPSASLVTPDAAN